jgi:hypothetical protein
MKRLGNKIAMFAGAGRRVGRAFLEGTPREQYASRAN